MGWHQEILYSGDLTATMSTRAVDIGDYREAYFVVHVNGVSGTSPTLVPEFEVDVGGGRWVHLYTIVDLDTQGNLTRLTAPTWEGKLIAAGTWTSFPVVVFGQRLRCTLTVGGTNPSFNVSVEAWLR